MTHILQQLLNAAPARGIVRAPAGIHELTAPLVLTQSRSLVTDGPVTLRATQSMASVLHIEGCTTCRVEGFDIEASDGVTVTAAVYLHDNANSHVTLDRVRVGWVQTGAFTYGVLSGANSLANDWHTLREVFLRRCGTGVWQRGGMNTDWLLDGVTIAGAEVGVRCASNMLLSRCYFSGCAIDVRLVSADAVNHRGVTMRHCRSEGGGMALKSDAMCHVVADACGWQVGSARIVEMTGPLTQALRLRQCELVAAGVTETEVYRESAALHEASIEDSRLTVTVSGC